MISEALFSFLSSRQLYLTAQYPLGGQNVWTDTVLVHQVLSEALSLVEDVLPLTLFSHPDVELFVALYT